MIDVVVVGGGAMGSAAAWRLAQKGLDVALLERFEAGHTRGGSHGASRIYRLVYGDPFYIDLSRRALVGWRELETAAGTTLLEVTGGVDHGELGTIAEVLDAQGVRYELLGPEAAAERWPGLRFDRQVLFQPDGGCVNADATMTAAQACAARLGAGIHHERPALAFRVRGHDRVEVDTADGAVVARRVVVAVGAWAAKLLSGLVDLPRITVTRERPAHFAPAIQAAWPTFIHRYGERSAYGLPALGEGVKIGFHHGGLVCDPDEPGSADEPPPGLVEYVREWVPGVDPTAVTPIRCLYDTTDSEDFVIDRVGPVTVATGFSGHGFKFVPEIGRILANLAWEGMRAPARFGLPAAR